MEHMVSALGIQIPNSSQNLPHLLYQHQLGVVPAASSARKASRAILADSKPSAREPVHHSTFCDACGRRILIWTHNGGCSLLPARVLWRQMGHCLDGFGSCLSLRDILVLQVSVAWARSELCIGIQALFQSTLFQRANGPGNFLLSSSGLFAVLPCSFLPFLLPIWVLACCDGHDRLLHASVLYVLLE